MTFSVTHQRRVSVTKSTERISRAGGKSGALWHSSKAGRARFTRGRLQAVMRDPSQAQPHRIGNEYRCLHRCHCSIGGNASGKQLPRFGWSGRARTQEPAACEEQRDGEVLELVQGQLGESQLLKQQQEASHRQHHPCF